MSSKFSVGDKVRLRSTGKWRVPNYIREELHPRTRTIVGIYYDSALQATLYEIGARGKGVNGYLFRSYQLIPSKKNAPIGRPNKLLLEPLNLNTAVLGVT